MSDLTPAKPLRWLSANDTATRDSFAVIVSAQAGLNECPPGSEAYQKNRQVMDTHLARIERTRAEKSAADARFYPDFANAQCDCQPDEPGCLHALDVSDDSESNRKITWPVPDGMLKPLNVVGKDTHVGSPSAKMRGELTETDNCRSGASDRPVAVAGIFCRRPRTRHDQPDRCRDGRLQAGPRPSNRSVGLARLETHDNPEGRRQGQLV